MGATKGRPNHRVADSVCVHIQASGNTPPKSSMRECTDHPKACGTRREGCQIDVGEHGGVGVPKHKVRCARIVTREQVRQICSKHNIIVSIVVEVPRTSGIQSHHVPGGGAHYAEALAAGHVAGVDVHNPGAAPEHHVHRPCIYFVAG
jgi:hypothetical protein